MVISMFFGRCGLEVEPLIFLQGIEGCKGCTLHPSTLTLPILNVSWWLPKETINCCEGLSVGNLACWAWERRRMWFCTREASRSFSALGVACETSTGYSSHHCCCEGRHILWEHDWVDNGSEDFLLSERTSKRMWFHIGLTGISSADLF